MVCKSRVSGTPWVDIRVEVAVKSRTPESRPASEMVSRFVMILCLQALGGWSVAAFLSHDGLRVDWRQVSYGKKGTLLVLRADGGQNSIERFQRPSDVEGRIVPKDGPFSWRIVEISSFVEDF